MNEELGRLYQQLDAANRHKSAFLASMFHELRTPLNAIIGFSEVLVDRLFGDLGVKQEEYLNNILDGGRYLLSLINDILDLSGQGRPDPDLPTGLRRGRGASRGRGGRRADPQGFFQAGGCV